MTFRSFLASLMFALGLTCVLSPISFLIAHAVYGDYAAPGAGLKIGGAGLVLLIVAYLLGRSSQLPIRLIVYYIIAFGGMRIAALPLSRREFSEWATIDYTLVLVGVSLFLGALSWALRRARRLKSPAV